ncbi:hypothetical protein LJR045_000196 [Microbacterium sp. LjRoot45]|uniref:hypothetical protein n=1 Tax=Microbacterium sp. LjRoot45 TaxID=3342329 RepID=UPI003ED17162
MTRLLPDAVRVVRAELLRLAVVLAAAAGLSLTLGMMFPVQFALDTGGYRETAARSHAPIEAVADAEDHLATQLPGESSMMISEFATDAAAHGNRFGPVSLWVLLGTQPDPELTLMPDATRVAGSAREPDDVGDWADISADLAAALAVGPGDEISIGLTPTTDVTLRVRGIYAVREAGYAGAAVLPVDAIARHTPHVETEPTSLVTTASPDRVREMLTGPPWREALLDIGYPEPFAVSDVGELLTTREGESFIDLSLVLTLSGIAVAALLAIVVGETVAFVRTFRDRAEILVELGAPSTGIYRTLLLALAATTVVGVGVGAAVGTLAYAPGFAGPALPPSVSTVWWLTAAACVATGTGAAALATRAQRKKVLE